MVEDSNPLDPEAPTLESPEVDTGSATEAGHLLGAERRIGPYSLVRELGHGGMGTVYLAARADDEYQKQVAIKLIRGAGGGELIRHFRRERQILAGLEHPNIARLLDGGTTSEGLSYLVMEYVEGEPLDRYCDHRNLSIRARLELFRVVCAAVQYAHRNLVVHRDLKPSNILVTGDGVPKLLDFGLAKFLEPQVEGDVAAATLLALTPRYASPEQVRNGAITTATDVYSLGVILYELLTGSGPYRLKTHDVPEVLKAVCEEQPEKPSTVSSTRAPGVGGDRLRRRLRGELDNIVLQALRKEPERRYGSVEAFSEDIARHLDGRPVSARKPTTGYRLAKFVRRHTVGVAAATLLFALTLSFAVATAVQSNRIARERDKAKQLAAFMMDLFKVSDPSAARGNTITAREVLDRGVEKIERELQDEPEVKAALLATMGAVYTGLGLYDQARPMLESSLVARRELRGQDGSEVAESQHNLATLLWREGRYPEAEQLFREALATRRERHGDDPLPEIMTLLGLSNVLAAKGDPSGGEATAREAIALLRRIPEPPPGVLSGALGGLASIRFQQNDLTEAEALTREAIALQQRFGGADDPRAAAWVLNLATFLQARGDYAGAEAAFEQGLAVYRKVLGVEHPEVARNLNNFAVMLHEQGSYDRAEELAAEAVGIYRRSVGDDHPDLAPALDTLAAVLNSRGDHGGAEASSRQAVGIMRRAVGDDHLFVAYETKTLADALSGLGRTAEAEALYRQVIAINDRVLPAGSLDRTYAQHGLGLLLTANGAAAAAEPMLSESLALRRSTLAAGHWRIAESEAALGACLARMGRTAEGRELLERAAPVLAQRGRHTAEARAAEEELAAIGESAPGRPDRP